MFKIFSGVECHDTHEGARCGPCPRGYEGDGKQCHTRNACVDEPCAPGMQQQEHQQERHHHFEHRKHSSYNVIVN